MGHSHNAGFHRPGNDSSQQRRTATLSTCYAGERKMLATTGDSHLVWLPTALATLETDDGDARSDTHRSHATDPDSDSSSWGGGGEGANAKAERKAKAITTTHTCAEQPHMIPASRRLTLTAKECTSLLKGHGGRHLTRETASRVEVAKYCTRKTPRVTVVFVNNCAVRQFLHPQTMHQS